MKPIVIIPVGAMTRRDIRRLEAAGIIVAEAKDPPSVRYLEPPSPDRTAQERALMALARLILRSSTLHWARSEAAEMYVKMLLDGAPLQGQAVPHVTPAKTA